jgi:4-phospho-D-threonate 3-dehydrogenase / 4-phospho-D-erythronate 3-dehydrogenase
VAVSEPRAALATVAVTMGDAAGIGPEVIVKALALHPEIYLWCRPLVVGDARLLNSVGHQLGLDVATRVIEGPEHGAFVPGSIDCVSVECTPPDIVPGQLSARAGEGSYRFIQRAVALALEHRVDAICTAPLNKAALHLAGHIYPGHTELLAELTGAADVAMMLTTKLPSGQPLRVAHVTTHMGLVDAIDAIDPPRVRRVIELADKALSGAVGARPVRFAVCGINPHAGEGGLFGRGEEESKIMPALEELRAQGRDVQGPLPADTVFFRAGRGDFDCVVAMYHDQGHGPVKVLGLEGGVNVTLGLPIVRTSVDHGTAFDIAGQGVADERSLLSALEEAARLALVPAGPRRSGH